MTPSMGQAKSQSIPMCMTSPVEAGGDDAELLVWNVPLKYVRAWLAEGS